MNTGAFGENFPYSNFHDLNMDWIIKIAKDFLDQYTHIQEIITNGEQSLQELTADGLEQLQNKADTLENLLQQWYNTHSEDIANQLADALADLNNWYTQHQNYLDQTLLTKIAEFNNAADNKAQTTIASIPSDYTTLANDVSALDEVREKLMNNLVSIQYIDTTKCTRGLYYWHNGSGTSENADTWILEPFKVFAGVTYTFKAVYGYFSVIKYDDGTSEALTELTSSSSDRVFAPMAKDGTAYITIHNANIDLAVAMSGVSSYARPRFADSHLNQDQIESSNLKLTNDLNTIGNSSNIHGWGTDPAYTVSGNKISYTAPATGNNGFYITPNIKHILDDITIELNIRNNTGGRITVHVWDTVTQNFADHLYTLGTFNESGKITFNLNDVFANRPNLNKYLWVILFSNTGNNFTIDFESIKIFNGYIFDKTLADSRLSTVLNGLEYKTGKFFECGTDKQFTRLRDAVAEAIKYPNSTVIVYPGTYNLAQEFAEEIATPSGSIYGIELSNNVYVKFMSGSYVTALFPNSSIDISEHFSPFYSAGTGFTLDGLHIRASNCRYCVHDERNGQNVKYHNVYKNCNMGFTMDDPAQSGGTYHYMQCIGGGLGQYGYIEIVGGYYRTINNLYTDEHSEQPISYHNGYSPNCDNRIFISNVFIAGRGIIRLGCYGSSTIKSMVYVTGCRMWGPVYKMIEAPSQYNIDNFEVIDWNNTIVNP